MLSSGPSRVSPSPDQGQWGGKENDDSRDEYINGEISPTESQLYKCEQTQPDASHIFGIFTYFLNN